MAVKSLERAESEGVIQRWNPPDEERWRRGFNFYIHTLDKKTSLWNEMINKLKPGETNQIKGYVFSDNSIVWSNDVAAHMYLLESVSKSHPDIMARFQTKYSPSSSEPELWISSDNQGAIDNFINYFKRSIDPQIPLSIWTSTIRVNPQMTPMKVDMKKLQ